MVQQFRSRKRIARSAMGLAVILALVSGGCGGQESTPRKSGAKPAVQVPDTLRLAGEAHLRNVRQLTFGGENAEAYFSPDGRELVFQSTRPPFECDQIFRMPLEGGEPVLVSTGQGRTTCAYFMPDSSSILYSSTHLGGASCPPKPDYSLGYVWPIYDTFDIFLQPADGPLVKLTDTPGYDAEATVSPVGDRIVFTSTRDGDLDIYTMKLDGSDVRRLTKRVGYEGGPFYSRDGQEIVYRAYYPANADEERDFKDLLDRNLIRPGVLNLYVMNADGSNKRQILENGAANFAPYFFPHGEKIIFSSNMDDPKGRNFELYMIGKDGTGLERVTYNETFDGFPMFSPDGKYLVFASNRNNVSPHETNVFIAEWVD